MRAAVYLRISEDKSGSELGVTRQREDAAEMIGRRGWTLVEEFCDNDTSAAGKVARPRFLDMLAAIERGDVDVVVGWTMDRTLRSGRDRVRVLELGKEHGITIALVRGSDMDLSTPSGRFAADILGAAAQNEIEVKADRQRRAAQQRADRGLPWCSRRPFGYSPDGASTAPTVDELRTYYERVHARRPDVPVPSEVELVSLAARIPREADLLREAYVAVLSGASVRGIAQRWNAAGVLTTRGGRWHGATVSQLLRNPRNAGFRTRGRDEKREEVGLAAWPAVVAENTFRSVVAILADPQRRVGSGRERKYLLTGIALCGRCNAPMGSGRATSTGARVYTCKRHHHLSRAGEPVDDLVADVVVRLLSQPKAVAKLTAPAEPGPDLNVEAVALRSRLDSLAVDFADGALTASQLRTATERLRARLGEVESRMRSASRVPVLAELVGAPDVAARWAALPLDRRRAVVNALMTVTILPAGRGRGFDPRTVQITPRV